MASITVETNYKPHPKQMLLHKTPVSTDEITIVFFGGDRGGGKSGGILGDAFMFGMTYPGAKICIIRETIDAVKQSFLDKLPTLFPETISDGFRTHKLYEYKEKSHSYYPSRTILLPNGSYITLQPIADYRMAMAKQGWEFNYLAVDEVTKQEERTVDYLITMVRSAQLTNPKTKEKYMIPTKIVLSGNPGGRGHKWVKRRFIDTTVTKKDPVTNRPLETKDYIELVQDPRDEKKKIKRVVKFIPSSWMDNPYLNPAYVANLMALPESKRKMDMDGNWDVVAGKMFEVRPEAVIPPRVASEAISDSRTSPDIYISVDWGYKPSYHAALWHAVTTDNRVITFKKLYGQELVFEDFVKEIVRLSDGMHIEGTCLPHDMFRHGDRHRDQDGKVIGETKAEVFDTYNLNAMSILSGKGNVGMRNDKIHSALKAINPDGTPQFRITTTCDDLLNELEYAMHDEFNPDYIDASCLDHAIDAYGLFLVFYSDDIAPIESEQEKQNNLQGLQRRLAEDEEKFMSSLDDNGEQVIIVDDYDSLY